MPPINPHVLLAIAYDLLDRIFPGQIPVAREELVTSDMRQRVTHGGHAGVELVPAELRRLLATRGIAERDMPRVLWDLSVA